VTKALRLSALIEELWRVTADDKAIGIRP